MPDIHDQNGAKHGHGVEEIDEVFVAGDEDADAGALGLCELDDAEDDTELWELLVGHFERNILAGGRGTYGNESKWSSETMQEGFGVIPRWERGGVIAERALESNG